MRQATEFDQQPWETLGGAAAQVIKVNRAETNRAASTQIGHFSMVDPISAARGRRNAQDARRAKARKTN